MFQSIKFIDDLYLNFLRDGSSLIDFHLANPVLQYIKVYSDDRNILHKY